MFYVFGCKGTLILLQLGCKVPLEERMRLVSKTLQIYGILGTKIERIFRPRKHIGKISLIICKDCTLKAKTTPVKSFRKNSYFDVQGQPVESGNPTA